MDEQILRVVEYEELVALNGRIAPEEIEHLCWLGAQVPDGGRVVELGSFRGKSICAIDVGIRAAGRLNVFLTAVDLWDKGVGVTASKRYSTSKTWHVFLRQTREMGVHVEALKMRTAEAGRKWKGGAIDLLFIDAAHDYASVRQDYELWGRWVKPGGYIAFHDYAPKWPGVVRLIDETVRPSGRWVEERVHRHIWSARRK